MGFCKALDTEFATGSSAGSLRPHSDTVKKIPGLRPGHVLHHLSLPVHHTTNPPASLLLCGVLCQPRLRAPTLTFTHRFLSKIYRDACKKYRDISTALSLEPD